jgi:hypothetical protein
MRRFLIGTWFLALATLVPPAPPAALASELPQPAGIEGAWQGALQIGAIKLRLVFNVKGSGDARTATLDSIDQGAKDIPVDSVAEEMGTVRFTMNALMARFEGTLSDDGKRIVGKFEQAGQSLPLILERTDRAFELNRPQEPKPPFPYESEEVRFANKAAGIELAGTLTLPMQELPSAAVVLISGSGAQDRDETLLGHKPFLVLADHLTRQGTAVLRVDDRGVGGSGGDPMTATTEDFAGDVLAAVEFLKNHDRIDAGRIGLVGHSEGGLIAPMAAARTNDVAFIVLLAGPGLPGDQIIYLQGELIGRAMGASEAQLKSSRALQEELFKAIQSETDGEVVKKAAALAIDKYIAALPEAERTEAESSRPLIEQQLEMLELPWFRYFLSYDPRPALSKVRCPVLALTGEKDLQVPPDENLGEIEKAVRAGGNNRVTVLELPGLNHLFQTCTTGAPSEYGEIEETFSPSALSALSDWIKGVAAGPQP